MTAMASADAEHDPPPAPAGPPRRVVVFVSGRGSNLKALLEAQAQGRLGPARIVGVFSDVAEPPAFEHARAHGVPTVHLPPAEFGGKAAYEAATLTRLRDWAAELIVLAGYMRVVGPTLLAAFPERIINIHPSLLPAFPGLHAQRQAVEHGVKVAGCTVHFVEARVDSGPILLQRAVACRPGDTEETLAARILAEEHQALPEAVRLIAEGKVRVVGRKVLIADSGDA